MRKRKLAYNAITALVFQGLTVISGIILPRMIIDHYGSSVNGLINSIFQFLNIIAFFELGIGAVVQAALYKPLADNDEKIINEIMSSAGHFFSTLAKGLLIYIVILIGFYPIIIHKEYDWIYTSFLIIAMGISLFAEYYFGMTDILLLSADQKAYIQYVVRSVTVLINVFVCAISIGCNLSIQLVKILSSLVFLLRPVAIRIYVNKHYEINRKAEYSRNTIPQKWNGVAQHIASIIISSTDSIVLTLFSTLSNVSIYSVYYMIVNGVAQILNLTTNGFTPLLGEFWAKKEKDNLGRVFNKLEWISHAAITAVFGITGVLIVPFVLVYTRNVTDADYNQPLFAVLITCAVAAYSLRRPYNMLILASGKFKETQMSYVIAAALNIVISIVSVAKLGLIGVAIGTLISMVYHLVYMIIYDHIKILGDSFNNTLKSFCGDFILLLIGMFATRRMELENISYVGWGILAIKVSVYWIIALIISEIIMYPRKLWNIVKDRGGVNNGYKN